MTAGSGNPWKNLQLPRSDWGSINFPYHQFSCLRHWRVVHEELTDDLGLLLREAIEEELCVLVEVLCPHLLSWQEAKLADQEVMCCRHCRGAVHCLLGEPLAVARGCGGQHSFMRVASRQGRHLCSLKGCCYQLRELPRVTGDDAFLHAVVRHTATCCHKA
jgi:hypothetical protein